MKRQLRALERRAAALLPAPPWTFSQFAEAWPTMDALSRSLFETMASCPTLFPGDDSERIRGYLVRLGVNVEPMPFSMDDLEGSET